MKQIRIDDIKLAPGAGPSSARVTYTVTTSRGTHDLWMEVDDEYGRYLVADRCDAAVVAMVLMAMREGYEVITSQYPMSADLYYNLSKQVIPQLATADDGTRQAIDLRIPIANSLPRGGGVAAAMSLGVDSFTTLSEYGRDCQLENYELTHLTFFNVGAHHGFDWRIGRGKHSPRELYEGQLEKVRQFADENGYPLIAVDSNMAAFLKAAIGPATFYQSHTFRNMAAAMVLQKLIGKYYYSSAYNVSDFHFSLDGDTAGYEKWLLPTMSTDSMQFYSSNESWSRFDKTVQVTKMPESYDYLTVCFTGIDNCGECDKCRKTLMTLDILGDQTLELFAKSFDLQKYRNENREKLFAGIYSQMKRKGAYGTDFQTIFNYGLERGFQLLPRPELTKKYRKGTIVQATSSDVRILALPFAKAIQVGKARYEDELFECLGTYEGWSLVRNDDVEGYLPSERLKIVAADEIEPALQARIVGNTKVYDRPGASRGVAELASNSEVQLLRSYGKWYYVSYGDNCYGYIACDMAKIIVPPLDEHYGIEKICRTVAGTVVLCDKPAVQGRSIAQISKDTPFRCAGRVGSWVKVSGTAGSGYLPVSDVRFIEPVEYSPNRKATIISEVTLRALPTQKSNAVTTVVAGAAVSVIRKYRTWYEVKLRSGEIGYIKTTAVRVTGRKGRRAISKIVRRCRRIYGASSSAPRSEHVLGK